MNTFSRALYLSLSFSSMNAPLPLFIAAISCSIRARHTLSAPSSPQIALLASSVSLPFPPCSISLSRYDSFSFYLLPLDAAVLIRFMVFARHAFRLTLLCTLRVTADRSHILGRRISKLETCRGNQPASRTFVASDAEDIGYLGRMCVMCSFWPLDNLFSVIIIHIMSI